MTTDQSLFHHFHECQISPIETDKLLSLKPDLALTPFQIARGVYKVVKCNAKPALEIELQRCYTLLTQGRFSHQYSLMYDELNSSTSNTRPIAIFNSLGKNYGQVIDLLKEDITEMPEAFTVKLFLDSYINGHLEFMLDTDHRYEWSYCEFPKNSGNYSYHLKIHKIATKEWLPAARIVPAKFRNPSNGELLWSVEMNSNLILPHICFLSAFMVKRLRLFSIFNVRSLQPPKVVNNISFDDDNRVFNRSSKFFSDWVDELDIDSTAEITVKVYSADFLSKYYIPSGVLEYMERQILSNVLVCDKLYGITFKPS